jgi:PKD repeat protein
MIKNGCARFSGVVMALVVALCGCGGSGSGPAKQAPVAMISGSATAAPGAVLTLVATGSTDPQGETLTYAWNFGDGGTATGVVAQHTYAQAGTYTVSLTVTDTSGLSDTKTEQAIIAAPPTARPGGPYTAYVGTALTFNGSASSDPQGLPLTYHWSFGDNSSAGTGATPTHTYSGTNSYGGSGTFTVTLVVTNSAGVSSPAATTTVNISIPPPVVSINGPYTGKPTLPVNFTSSVVEPYESQFTYLWNFGDGATANVANPTHTYAATGTYNVSLTVTGVTYGDTATATTTAIILTPGTGPGLAGVVRSGTTPVVGARVYLLQANTTGYGQASVSLLSGTGQSDSIGSYVLSAADGTFALPTGFPCGTHAQVYVYAAGGSVNGNSNSQIGLMSALGACGYLGAASTVTVDEATTVAAAYGLSGYAVGGLNVSSPNTAAALTGIANAFLNAENLASSATGNALTTTPTGGTAPQAKMNTLASVLNACVSEVTANACSGLFNVAQTGSIMIQTTADAAISLAKDQGANASTLFALLPAAPAFTPVLTSAPHDWTMAITYPGLSGYGTQGLTIDGSGNVWVLQYPTVYGTYPHLTKFASNGNLLLDEDTTCANGTEAIPGGIAADQSGNIWLLSTTGASYIDSNGDEQSYYTAQYCTLSNAGVMISPPGGFNLGGSITTPAPAVYDLAVDGNGNGVIPTSTLLLRNVNGGAVNGNGYVVGNAPYVVAAAVDATGDYWVSSPGTNGVVKLSSSGALLSPANGYTGGGLYMPGSVAIDHSGNVWAINTMYGYLNSGTSVSELSPSGTALSPGTGFTSSAMAVPYSLAADGGGNMWVATGYPYAGPDYSVVELGPNGSVEMTIDHANSLKEYLDGPNSLAVDSTGSVWVSNGLEYDVTQFVGVATPVVTPLAANLTAPYSAPASRP